MTANPTPMLAQYLEIKKKYPDALLFYRMGDFYEMFFDDAVKAAPLLEVQLTSRDRNSADPIPMCGVPHHALTPYLQKLLGHGQKVAICEQLEDPATTKGIVKRDVVRVVTPSLVGDPDLVAEATTNFLVAIACVDKTRMEVASLDLLGGKLRSGEADSTRRLIDLFLELRPKEVLISTELKKEKWFSDILRLFPEVVVTVRDGFFERGASAAILAYLKETQKETNTSYVGNPEPLFSEEVLQIDPTSLASLEVIDQGPAEIGRSLFSVMDKTLTPMGRRLLKYWLMKPSANLAEIVRRHERVDSFIADGGRADALRYQLSQVRDLERLTTKTALGLAMPRDLQGIGAVLERLPEIKQVLGADNLELHVGLTRALGAFEDLPPANIREGGIFRDDYHPDICALRALSRDAKSTIAEMETREKLRTGIANLKIKYSRVFGYTIEVTKSHLTKVPREYQRKQTIANGERYVTEELKQFEEKVITAEHRLKKLEESLFLELRSKVAERATELLATSRILAELDLLLCFARVAQEKGYVRPLMHEGWDFSIEDGRHPVVENFLEKGTFVPNSIWFDDDTQTYVITGPNMAGKSTIMRQIALISLLAQAGSFVPAASADLGVVDSIFTRIGSSDDLTRGRSTFMVEMTEVARILDQATKKSLVLIDEIGRGTSTYDGLALAWSLLEYLHVETRAKLLFATHFHELTELQKAMPGLVNANVLVKKWNDEIVFLHKLAFGVCSQSYGIEVAQLAGLPSKVLLRAKDILGHLENQSRRADRARNRALEIHTKQLHFSEGISPSETQAGREN